MNVSGRSKSPIPHSVIMFDDSAGFKLNPKRRFRINSSKVRPTTEQYLPETPKLLSVYQLASQKLIPITNTTTKKDTTRPKIDWLTPIKTNIISEQIKEKRKDRLQMYKKMLEPKVIRTRMFSAGTARKRAISANQRSPLPLLFTFGKQQ